MKPDQIAEVLEDFLEWKEDACPTLDHRSATGLYVEAVRLDWRASALESLRQRLTERGVEDPQILDILKDLE